LFTFCLKTPKGDQLCRIRSWPTETTPATGHIIVLTYIGF
jgi:hypothetical protein